MAIYHMEVKVISRGTGRSAVAAAAYMSCDKIYNDYDGVQHDYSKKQGLVWEQVFLPQYAPPEWADRSALWNAVEESEKSKDSRLAREFVVALPIELKKDEWIKLLSEYIQDNFVSEGMCADVAIHDTDGHNPHAHIMLTVRPLDKNGKWQNKTEKEYLCIRNGEEKGFTASEFKTAKEKGWEKQYQYKVEKKKVYMPPSAAEAQGYERASKYPKSTRYGRQNPIVERWNSDEQLVLWRKEWADISNKYLWQAGVEETISHRSHKDRGIDEQPTVHEGVAARVLGRNGIISDRCELNRQIREDNSLLRTLKETIQKLALVVRSTVPALARAIETVRQEVLMSCYQLNLIRSGQQEYKDYLSKANSGIQRYDELVENMESKNAEYLTLLAEKRKTPHWEMSTHRQLDRQIEEMTEVLEKLKSEKTALLKYLGCFDENDISKVKKGITITETWLEKLNGQEEKYSAKLDAALKEYRELREQVAGFDIVELYEARQAIRPDKEQDIIQRLQKAYGEKYSNTYMANCKQMASELLDEESEIQYVMEKKQQQQQKQVDEQQQVTQQPPKKKKSRGGR